MSAVQGTDGLFYSDESALEEGGIAEQWVDEALNAAIAQNLRAEYECELEQDEHPLDFDAELEDEQEEAARTSRKRLKREIRAEAIHRLELAARTEEDFLVVIGEWDRLDRNRERRERAHENLRGDIPLEYMAVPDPKIVPHWMGTPDIRARSSGNYLDIIYDCPYEMHNLTSDEFISGMIASLSEDRKEVLYFLSLHLYSTGRLARIRGQSDRYIRKLRTNIHRDLQRQMYEHLCDESELGRSLTLRERRFLIEFQAALDEMGSNAVLRRENKSKAGKKSEPDMGEW